MSLLVLSMPLNAPSETYPLREPDISFTQQVFFANDFDIHRWLLGL